MQSCAGMSTSRTTALMFFAAWFHLCSFFSWPNTTVAAQVSSNSLRVDVEPIEVDPKRPGRKAFGALQLLAAFHLHSKDHRFGGLSGISFGANGRLYAISDRGYWFSAQTTIDSNGALSDLSDWQTAPMLMTTKTPVSGRLRDAEALARSKDGSFLVGFEGVHRIWRYAAPPATFESIPTSEQTPPTLARAPRNGGIEALTEFPDGRLLVLTEDLENPDGSTKGWVRENGAWAELSYRAADGFYVTDCAALANGDLLVLERRFALLAILSTRVTLVTASSVKPGAKLAGKELLKLEQPLAVENFEGIAVRQSVKGTSIFLASDDNYSPFQQTLLLQFLLPNAGADALTTHAIP
jgi:hypothetical protein